MNLIPLKCNPIYKPKIWGGRWLKKYYNRDLPENELIGESWELSIRPDDTIAVLTENNQYKNIKTLINQYPKQFLGNDISNRTYTSFPLLAKVIDANSELSIQVHPDDKYAKKVSETDTGKFEMWYILDTEPGAQLITGFNQKITADIFRNSIKDNTLTKYLNYIDIKPNDIIIIEPGTVHAILKGVRLFEIQQNSDLTFRIYDWDRKDKDGNSRSLHIKKSCDVTDFDKINIDVFNPAPKNEDGFSKRILSKNRIFCIEEISVFDTINISINKNRFEYWFIVDGNGLLHSNNSEIPVAKGESWFIPAYIGNIKITGNPKFLRTYIE